VALTAASLDRVWFVPSRSALFAEFENRCASSSCPASSSCSSSSSSSPYPSLAVSDLPGGGGGGWGVLTPQFHFGPPNPLERTRPGHMAARALTVLPVCQV
jgi:hypothetical protein